MHYPFFMRLFQIPQGYSVFFTQLFRIVKCACNSCPLSFLYFHPVIPDHPQALLCFYFLKEEIR